MQFIDEATIYVKAGNGGNGAISFRREKFIPKGGPDGGDGGKGGDIIIRCVANLNTLLDFKYTKEFIAQNGENGHGSNSHGKSGEDLIINVPVGTEVYFDDEEEARVAKLEVIVSGDFSIMPSVPVIMKVYDDSTGMTRIKKINTRDSIEHINSVIQNTIGRDTLVSVMVSEGVMKDLDSTNLREAFKSIFKGELHSLFVNAI